MEDVTLETDGEEIELALYPNPLFLSRTVPESVGKKASESHIKPERQ